MTPLPAHLKKTGGEQEGEHGWVQHVQEEQYQRNVIRDFVIWSDPVGNPKPELSHPQSMSLVFL